MWFVTNNGLCRFDGKTFEIFTKQSHGLYNSTISSIISDNDHGIVITYFIDKSKFAIENRYYEVIDINTFKVKKLNEYYKNIPFKDDDISEIRPNENNKVLFFLKPFFNIQIETFSKSKVWQLNEKGQFFRSDEVPIKPIKFNKQNNKVEAIIESCLPSTTLDDKSFYIINNTIMSNYKKNKFHQLFTLAQIPFGLNNSTIGIYKYKDMLLVAAFDFIGIKKKNTTELLKNEYNFNFCETDSQLWLAANNLRALDLKTKKVDSNQIPGFGEIWTIFLLIFSHQVCICLP